MIKFLFPAYFVSTVLLLLISVNQSLAQDIRYQKRYFTKDLTPGEKPESTNFYDIESLRDGGFLVQGFLTDTVTPNPNQYGYIARYDCLGNKLWGKVLGRSIAPSNTVFGAVETESGDIAFSFNLGTGFFQASILCGLFDADGNTKWIKRIGNNTEFGRDIAQTPDGGFVVAGSTAFFGTDRRAADIYVLKLSPTGDIEWTKTFGTPNTTYDEAFAVKIDKQQRIIVTGRCIADGTFQAFLLKLDLNGDFMTCKTYGYNNQRTNAYDIIIDNDNNYLITGFTTILEIDHASSEADPFLIKTDSLLNPIFMNVYEVNVGRDLSTLGESLALLDDGSYAVGVSALSFSLHDASGPNSPGKNALYIVNKDGSLRRAMIYNMKGSQYTRVRKSSLGGVVLSGFTTAYANNISFQGLIIKTDPQFQSGCHDIDVTRELNTFKPTWQVADYVPEIKTGKTEVPYSSYFDSLLSLAIICEEVPVLTPDFIAPDTTCPGTVFFEESTSGPFNKKYWIIGSDTMPNNNGLLYTFSQPGKYEVTFVMEYACIKNSITKSIFILDGAINYINKTICDGDSFIFKGKTYTQNTTDTINIKTTNGCDSLFFIKIEAIKADVRELETTFCGNSTIYNNTLVTRDTVLTIDSLDQNGCLSLRQIVKIKRVYDRQEVIMDSLLFCESILIKDSIYRNSASVKYDSIDPNGCDLYPKELILSKKTIELPNVFFPNNDQDRNRVFRPVNLCETSFSHYLLQIYNRWGQLVFETGDPNQSWNGQHEGQASQIETYLVYFEYELPNVPGIIFKKRSDLNLIR